MAAPGAEGVHISAHLEFIHQPQVESSVLSCDHRMVAEFKEKTRSLEYISQELRGLDSVCRRLKAWGMLTGVDQRE